VKFLSKIVGAFVKFCRVHDQTYSDYSSLDRVLILRFATNVCDIEWSFILASLIILGKLFEKSRRHWCSMQWRCNVDVSWIVCLRITFNQTIL